MKNIDIRQEAKARGVKHWQIADKLEISEFYLCRKLRHELPLKEREAILEAINEIAKEAAE